MIQTVEPTHKIVIGIERGKLVSIDWGNYIKRYRTIEWREDNKKELIAVLKNAIKIVRQVKV